MRKRKTGQNLHLSNLNFKIIIYALILSIIGIFMVHSATQNEAVTGMLTTTQKQILGMVIGLVLMMILTCIDYHKLIKYSIVFYVISMALLIYVKYINPLNISNANRWMRLPGFGTIQPSEFSKVAVVLMAVFGRDWLNGLFDLCGARSVYVNDYRFFACCNGFRDRNQLEVGRRCSWCSNCFGGCTFVLYL